MGSTTSCNQHKTVKKKKLNIYNKNTMTKAIQSFKIGKGLISWDRFRILIILNRSIIMNTTLQWKKDSLITNNVVRVKVVEGRNQSTKSTKSTPSHKKKTRNIEERQAPIQALLVRAVLQKVKLQALKAQNQVIAAQFNARRRNTTKSQRHLKKSRRLKRRKKPKKMWWRKRQNPVIQKKFKHLAGKKSWRLSMNKVLSKLFD